MAHVALSAAVLAVPFASFAADDEEITISQVTIDSCDETIVVSTSVSLSDVVAPALDQIVVTLDGTIVFGPEDVDDTPATHDIDSLSVSKGSHTIEAFWYDNDDLDEVLASDSYTFDIDCERSPQLYDASNQHVNPNGSGGDVDCCPGSGGGASDSSDDGDDEHIAPVAKKAAQVKGVSVKKAPSLKPLNQIFRSVYGRNPTSTEWNYWANRMLEDKPGQSAIYGAMQWHKLRGHTMGA